MSNGNLNPNIKWCDECKKYYNPEVPHECQDRELRKNREQLEDWLRGKYKVKE